MANAQRWLRVRREDDVATALADLNAGLEIADPDGDFRFALRQRIPFGHKFAVRAVAKGGLVRKYGQVIGSATQAIEPGEHVHVHNVASRRGRGDLAKGGSA